MFIRRKELVSPLISSQNAGKKAKLLYFRNQNGILQKLKPKSNRLKTINYWINIGRTCSIDWPNMYIAISVNISYNKSYLINIRYIQLVLKTRILVSVGPSSVGRIRANQAETQLSVHQKNFVVIKKNKKKTWIHVLQKY